MGARQLPRIVSALVKHGRSPTIPVAVIERATTKEEKVFTGTLDTIAERAKDVQPPATVVVGEVVGIGMTLASQNAPLARARPSGGNN